MAENTQQLDTTGESSNYNQTSPFTSPIKRIDFAALRLQKSPVAPLSNLTSSQHQDAVSYEYVEGAPDAKELQQKNDDLAVQMDTQRLQLISPPPEETLSLRRTSGLVRISAALYPSNQTGNDFAANWYTIYDNEKSDDDDDDERGCYG